MTQQVRGNFRARESPHRPERQVHPPRGGEPPLRGGPRCPRALRGDREIPRAHPHLQDHAPVDLERLRGGRELLAHRRGAPRVVPLPRPRAHRDGDPGVRGPLRQPHAAPRRRRPRALLPGHRPRRPGRIRQARVGLPRREAVRDLLPGACPVQGPGQARPHPHRLSHRRPGGLRGRRAVRLLGARGCALDGRRVLRPALPARGSPGLPCRAAPRGAARG